MLLDECEVGDGGAIVKVVVETLVMVMESASEDWGPARPWPRPSTPRARDTRPGSHPSCLTWDRPVGSPADLF